MKKHELLKYAYDNYPKGTKFLGATGHNPIPHESTGDLRFSDDYFCIINYPNGKGIIYDGDKDIWAEIVEDKKPLLVSEDGVDLFEGDKIYEVTKHSDFEGWRFNSKANYGAGYWVCNDNQKARWIETPKKSKAFSSEQSALEWIEAQQPKSYEVKLFNGGTANLYKDEIILHGGIKLAPSDLEDLSHSFRLYFGKELK